MASQQIRNMEEFAAVSGISRPTISKYFNDPGSVRASTRQRIEAALEQYDFRPNIYAVNQNRRLTKNIGIVVPFLSDPFFGELARNIEQLCINAGFRPILQSSNGDPALELENLESLRDLKPAGALVAPIGRITDRAGMKSFCDAVPTILFDNSIDDAGVAFFGHDSAQSVDMMVHYLCRTGAPPTFFEMREPSNPNALRRRAAFRAAVQRLGHPAHILQVEGSGWDFEEIGYREGKRVIAERLLPTDTVLCSNDRLAIGFLAAAYEMGLRVGRGGGSALRVAGHDDHPFSRFTCPSLTTVAQDYDAIARHSVDTLLALIDNGPPDGPRMTTLFNGKLVLRDSA